MHAIKFDAALEKTHVPPLTMWTPPVNIHDADFYTWTKQQIELLRAQRVTEIDIEHLIEELENMGASERRELINRLAVLLMHLLKWQYQPSYQCASWQATIREQRNQVRRILRHNPGLKPIVNEALYDAYEDAPPGAVRETGQKLSTFPGQCPWTFEQVTDDEFWPESQ